jgi:hypothetical protein
LTKNSTTTVRHPPYFSVLRIEDKTERPSYWHNWGDRGRIAGVTEHSHRTPLPGTWLLACYRGLWGNRLFCIHCLLLQRCWINKSILLWNAAEVAKRLHIIRGRQVVAARTTATINFTEAMGIMWRIWRKNSRKFLEAAAQFPMFFSL